MLCLSALLETDPQLFSDSIILQAETAAVAETPAETTLTETEGVAEEVPETVEPAVTSETKAEVESLAPLSSKAEAVQQLRTQITAIRRKLAELITQLIQLIQQQIAELQSQLHQE